MFFILALALSWHTDIQYVEGHTYVQEHARVDAVHVVNVEQITWEGPPFYMYEASACGQLFAIGEEPTREDAQRVGLAAIERHAARWPGQKCGGVK